MMIYMQHAQGMVKLATELGVELHTGKEVKKLITKEALRGIMAAELDDGTRKTADHFISNMEVTPAYEKLLDVGKHFIKKLEKRFEPSSSGLILHLGGAQNIPSACPS